MVGMEIIRRDRGIVGGNLDNTDRIDVEGRVIHYLEGVA